MKSGVAVILGFLCLAVFGQEAVVTLDDSSFDDYIKQHPRVLVEFYAPWCGHCKALEPQYKKAAEQLKNEGAETILAQVDATVEKNLASRFQIRGFPTLKYFTGDKDAPSEYGGGRTTDTIVSWIKKREKPAISFVTNVNKATKFQTQSRIALIGYFAKDTPEEKILLGVADKLRDELETAQVVDESVAKELNVDYPGLYLYTNFEGDDPKNIKFDGDISDEAAVLQFISSERFPIIDQIGPDNYQSYMDRGIPLVWIPLDPSDQKTKVNVIKALIPFAKRFKGKLSFTWIDSIQYKQYAESLGISEGGFLIQTADGASKWKYENDYGEKELNDFFEKYESGDLEKYLKSEPVPEKNDKPVYVLVGKTFGDVIGGDKDVFVEFYAPWCGHCKRLAPEYEKVGEAFQEIDDLVIAKIDATQNDSQETIQGFPTLIFYPRRQTEGIKYKGDRTAEAIIKWLKEKSSSDVSSVEIKTEL